MGYLKSVGTTFIYIVSFLAVITFIPNFPPYAEFFEYNIVPQRELTGVLALNDRLDGAEILFSGQLKGPEHFDSYNGELYTGLHGGYVVKIVENQLVPIVRFGQPCDGNWEEEKCGRPLGLQFNKKGMLYVSDPYYGIFEIDVKTRNYKKVIDITQPIGGKVSKIANSLDIASNGDIYWTDSSTEFSLYDGIFTFLANPSGRLIRYNAATKQNEVLVENLGFANGVKLSKDESFVIAAESTTSRIIKYNLKGPKAGHIEPFIQGLPGTPDNINSDGDDGFLVSLFHTVDAQHPLIFQSLFPHPYIRKMCARFLSLIEAPFKLIEDVFPNYYSKRIIHSIGNFESLRYVMKHKGAVLRIDKNGNIVDMLYSTNNKISAISTAYIHKNYLWIGSPFGESIARVPLKHAFPNLITNEERLSKAPKKSKVSGTTDTSEKPPVAVTTPKPPTTTPKPPTTTLKPPTITPKPPTTIPTPPTTTSKPPTTTPKPPTTTTTTGKPDTTKKPITQTSKTTERTTSKPTVTTSSTMNLHNSKLSPEAAKVQTITQPSKGVDSIQLSKSSASNDAIKQRDSKNAKGTPSKQEKKAERSNNIPTQK